MYEVKLRSSNATKDLEGVYQCGIQRQFDKLYIISSVTMSGNVSPFTQHPRAEVVSCERTNYDPLNEHIRFTRGRETCIRCRGIGYPIPSVGIYNHKGDELKTTRGVSVTKYINVADAGIAEATYTWLNPSASLFNRPNEYYSCRAINDKGSSNIQFKILLH